jgi:hypothetical protein
LIEELEMQKSNLVIRMSSREDETATRLFWMSKSPEERLDAVEFLREQYYVIRRYGNVPRLIKKLQMVDR